MSWIKLDRLDKLYPTFSAMSLERDVAYLIRSKKIRIKKFVHSWLYKHNTIKFPHWGTEGAALPAHRLPNLSQHLRVYFFIKFHKYFLFFGCVVAVAGFVDQVPVALR